MLNDFVLWYNDEFKRTDLYHAMEDLAEDSPWHREHSIAVHTDMVVMEYLQRSDSVLGAFAAAFHDVGKPGACQYKHKESRGDYKSFNGHEQMSARMWEDWAVKNWSFLFNEFGDISSPQDIYRIGYMIEFHKPWDLRKKDKLEKMALTLMALGIDQEFVHLVKADTWGRISDDFVQNRAKVTAWCNEFENRCMSLCGHSILHLMKHPEHCAHRPTMYVPIAASGSGKSTWMSRTVNTSGSALEGANVFSLDLMRHELYGDEYDEAFLKSTKDKRFRAECNARFRDLLRENKDLILDNTNTSRKNRNFYLTEARNRGYRLSAVLLPVELETVKNRQQTRTDKHVPAHAVERQYMGLALPQYGEFDEVIVYDSNLTWK